MPVLRAGNYDSDVFFGGAGGIGLAEENPGFKVTGPVASFVPENSGLTFLDMPRSFPLAGCRPTFEPGGATRLGEAARLAGVDL